MDWLILVLKKNPRHVGHQGCTELCEIGLLGHTLTQQIIVYHLVNYPIEGCFLSWTETLVDDGGIFGNN
jgi:hypothetical protein